MRALAFLQSPIELVAASTAIWCTWLAGTYFAGRRGQVPFLQWQKNSFNAAVLSRCPTLRSKYNTPPFLSNGHVETIFAALTRVAPWINYSRTQLALPDGGTVALDYEDTQKDLPFDADRVCQLSDLLSASICTCGDN